MPGLGRLPPLTAADVQALRAALPTLAALRAVFDAVAASAPECVVAGDAAGASEEQDEADEGDLGVAGFEAPAARLSEAGAQAFAARVHALVLAAVDGSTPSTAADFIRPMLASAAADNAAELRFAAKSRRAFSFQYLLGNPVEGLLSATEPLVGRT